MLRRDLLRRLGSAIASAIVGAAGGCFPRRPVPQEDPYLPLEEEVKLPIESLTGPWQRLPFKARLNLTTREGKPRPVAFPGILLRLPPREGPASATVADPTAAEGPSFRAYCLTCPHELCTVNWIEDPSRTVQLQSGEAPPRHPLLYCPCHFSVYDPLQDGKRLSGPAERGAYRFRLEMREGNAVVTHVEAGVKRFIPG